MNYRIIISHPFLENTFTREVLKHNSYIISRQINVKYATSRFSGQRPDAPTYLLRRGRSTSRPDHQPT